MLYRRPDPAPPRVEMSAPCRQRRERQKPAERTVRLAVCQLRRKIDSLVREGRG